MGVTVQVAQQAPVTSLPVLNAKEALQITRVQDKVPFCLLADPSKYQAHTFEFIPNRNVEGKPDLQAWVEVFRGSRPQFHKMAMEDQDVPESERQAAADRFFENYEKVLKDIEAHPEKPLPGFAPDTVNCVSLSAMRDRCLREQGFADCFKAVKASETALAISFLPQLLQEIDAITNKRERFETVVRGVIAGNIFDLGAAAGADMYNSGKMPKFQDTRNNLHPRPWCVDDLDLLLDALTECQGAPFKKAVMFCDNSGSDIIMGMVPFARELIRSGVTVVIAANEIAAINDVTAAELRVWLKDVAEVDPTLAHALAEGTLSVASTGTDNCVIDLKKVSPKLNEIAADADFVVLEGMGRGIETNLRGNFKVAALKVGMIKHREVAMELEGDMFDCVCKFNPAPAH